MLRPHRPRARLRALAAAACTAALGATLLGVAGTPPAGAAPADRPAAATAASPTAADDKVIGYFTNWGVYDRNYHVKNIVTSGSAEKLTHINYAFGNVQNGKCTIGDAYADYEKAYTAEESADGVADTWDQEVRSNFNQLRKLKELHPDIRVLWSFGGWSWSGGFGEAAQNPAAFAKSCYDLVEDPRWADVFSDAAISKLKSLGIPSEKLLLGIGFYGRGWTGVTQSEPGGSATGAAPGTYEAGIEDCKVLKNTCPATGTVAGTAYAHCGTNWWSYDTPETIGTKMAYKDDQGLGGTFFWELSRDTQNGELIKAIS